MTERGRIAALILAAGRSSRMGDFKPLLPLGGSTAIEEAVKRFRHAGIQEIGVVTGHRAEEIAPVLDRLEVGKIFNPHYDMGMLSSVLAGIRGLEPEVEAFFLLPADIPLVKARTMDALVRAYRTAGGGIIHPCFQGLRGHPPLIPTSRVKDLPEDYEGGLRAFLGRYDDEATDIDVIDESILLGCNTLDEYRKLRAYGMREDIPTERECRALWTKYGLSELLIAHCRLVAQLAGTLAVSLNRAGLDLDTDLILASGYLHDLAKGRRNHAAAGAEILEELGYGRVGRIVASHTDLRPGNRHVDESDLIYLADKYVEGDRLVTIEERFDSSLEKYAGKPDILKAVAKRYKDARTIRERLEKLLPVSVDEIIRKFEFSLLPRL
jgi:molybdenum cofactor cytidylyltransferase